MKKRIGVIGMLMWVLILAVIAVTIFRAAEDLFTTMKVWHWLVLVGAVAAFWKFGGLKYLMGKIDAAKAGKDAAK